MSIIFHQITTQNNGLLPLAVGTGPAVGAVASQGLLVDETGAVLATLAVPPVYWSAGLPFDGNGRLVVEAAAVVSFNGGLGFTATGALAVVDATPALPIWYENAILLVNFEQTYDMDAIQDLSPNDTPIVQGWASGVVTTPTMSIINTILLNGNRCAMMRLDSTNGFNMTNALYAQTGVLPVFPISLEFTLYPQNIPVMDAGEADFLRPFVFGAWGVVAEFVYGQSSEVEGYKWRILFGEIEAVFDLPQGSKYLISILFDGAIVNVYLQGALIFSQPYFPAIVDTAQCFIFNGGVSIGQNCTVLIDDIIVLSGYALRTGPFTPEPEGILGGLVQTLPGQQAAPITTYNQGVAQLPSGALGVTGLAPTPPPVLPPGQVTGVVLQSGVNGIPVAWNAVTANPAVTNYLIEWRAVGETAWLNATVPATPTNYVIYPLVPSSVYEVRVSAINIGGTGPASVVQSIQPSYPSPSAVAGFAFTPQINALDLTWAANSPLEAIAFYTVYWSTVTPINWQNQNFTGTSGTLTGLLGGTEYTLWISATNPAGEGPYDINLLATPLAAAPGQVTGLNVVPGVSELTASWATLTAVPAVTSYTVEWRVNGGGAWTSQNAGLSTSVVIPGLVGDQTYNVRVFATNAGGNGPYSSELNGTPYAPVGTVTGVVLTPGVQQITVAWDALTANPAITNYFVQYRIFGTTTWTSVDAGATTSRVLTGLVGGATYEVVVYAVNAVDIGPQTVPVQAQTTNNPSNLAVFGIFNSILRQAYRMDVTPWTPIASAPGLLDTAIQACAYSAAVNRIAFGSGTSPNRLQVYDTSVWPWVKLTGITQPAASVTWLEFSKDGTLLAAATSAGAPSLVYTTATWASKALDTAANTGITINAANTRVAIAANTGGNGPLQIWDITGASAVLTTAPTPAPTNQVYSVSFHPARNILAVNGVFMLGRVYDLDTNTSLGNMAGLTGNFGYTLTFSTYGNRIAVSTSTMFRVYDCTNITTPATWPNLAITNPPAAVDDQNYSIQFSDTDTLLLARDLTSPDKSIAFDVTVNPIVRVTDFDQIRASTYMQAAFTRTPTLPLLPGQVTGLLVTSGVTQLVLNWTAVSASNPVTNYVVQYRPSTQAYFTNVTLGAVTTHTLTGLTAGVTYTLRVVAVNTGGWGVPSASQTAVPFATPVVTATWGAMTRNLGSGAPNDSQVRGMDTNGTGVWVAVFQNGYASRSTDDGASWTALPRYLNSGATTGTWANSVRTNRAGVWVAVLSGGYAARSTDNGVTWTALPQGLNSGANNDFYIVNTDLLGVWIACGANGRASRSTDNGVTWAGLPQGLNTGNATGTLGGLGTNRLGVWIAFGDDGWASRSTDNGATWVVTTRGLGTGAPATEDGRAITASRNIFVAGTTAGYASRSTDYGATWTALTRGLNTGATTDLHIINDGQLTFLCVAQGGWASYSIDSGATWTALTRWLNSGDTAGDGEGIGTKGNNSGMFMAGFSNGYAARTPALPVVNVPGVLAANAGALANNASVSYNCIATAQMNTPQITVQNTAGVSGTIDFIFDGQVRNSQFLAASATTNYTFNPIANAHPFNVLITARSTGIVLGQIAIIST